MVVRVIVFMAVRVIVFMVVKAIVVVVVAAEVAFEDTIYTTAEKVVIVQVKQFIIKAKCFGCC